MLPASARVLRTSSRLLTTKQNPTLRERYPRASRRRRAPSTPPPKQPEAATSASTEEAASESDWVNSEERAAELTSRERWVMGVALATGVAAVAGLTLNKWEVERQLKERLTPEEQQRWREGRWVPGEKPQSEGGGHERAG